MSSSSSSDDEEDEVGSNDDSNNNNNKMMDVSIDPRLYRIRLPRRPGIEWGTDLSFSFVYVRTLDLGGPADLLGIIQTGDQLCEFQPIYNNHDNDGIAEDDDGADAVNLIGAGFDTVMNQFASLPKHIEEIDLVFFRGSKAELKEACGEVPSSSNEEDETITITVITQNDNTATDDATTDTTTTTKKTTTKIVAPMGCNVRKVLTDHGINVYQSFTRWTNCKGKQLCGTCIVNISSGGIYTNRKSMDEDSTLRENPDTYRLSCVTFAYGDITVEVFPPINAAQWTR